MSTFSGDQRLTWQYVSQTALGRAWIPLQHRMRLLRLVPWHRERLRPSFQYYGSQKDDTTRASAGPGARLGEAMSAPQLKTWIAGNSCFKVDAKYGFEAI